MKQVANKTGYGLFKTGARRKVYHYRITGLVFLLLVIFTLPAAAQEGENATEKREFTHSLGVGAGFTTGVGLSYRYLPDQFGFQTTFAPLIVDEYESLISFGFSFLYKIFETGNTNFYLYQGNHFLYDKWKKESSPYMEDESEVDIRVHNGLGLGFELIFLDNIGSNLMVGYAARDNFSSLGLTGELAIYYKF
ncbi:MAG: hypothetical protein R6U62_07455 [Bacteroidales bacterium]